MNDLTISNWPTHKISEIEAAEIIEIGRGEVISKNDILTHPGDYPVYSSSSIGTGVMGFYNKYSFDEELTTWSIDGGGVFFYRKPHKFSVTNVGGWIRVLDKNVLNARFMTYALSVVAKIAKYDWTHKAHPSVIRKELSIPLPPLSIQNQIVTILDTYNEITELQAERVRLLKLEKDVLLEKIFAPEGGFKFSLNGRSFNTAEWLKRPLSSCIKLIGGEQINRVNLSPVRTDSSPYPVWNGGISPSGYHTKANRKAGTIAISGGGNSSGFTIMPQEDFWSSGHNLTVELFDKESVSFDYLIGLLKYIEKESQREKMGAFIPSLNVKKFLGLDRLFPSLKAQQLIGDYFREIDSRIKLEEERLQLLKIQQEVALEQIFSK